MHNLSEQAQEILKKRYLRPNENSWDDLARRVAKAFAQTQQEEEDFFFIISNALFIPNTPALINAGKEKADCAACYFIPIEDSIEGIFQSLKDASLIFKQGGGVGFKFSSLRPANSKVAGTNGISSGPISFMKIYDTAIEQVKQGGIRRGAAMGLMLVDHPDIVKFIKCKNEDKVISNFNISVGITDEFMDEATNPNSKKYGVFFLTKFGDKEYYIDKKTDTPVEVKNALGLTSDKLYYTAKEIWDLICYQAWKNAEPGVIFYDTLRENDKEIQGINPCQPGFATVLTPDGIRTFDDIRIGSVIWSGKEWTKVVNKKATGKKEVYRYQTTTGFFIGTPDHRVIQDGERIKVKDAKTIDQCVGNQLVPYLEPLAPIDIMDGLVVGDGSRHGASNNLIVLYIGENDQDYFSSEVAELIGENYRVGGDLTFKVETTIHHSHLMPTYVRQIPNHFIYADHTKARGFLRGLYSANGSVIADRISFKSASFELIQQVQVMLSGLGIRSYYTVNKPTKVQFSNGEYECKQSYDLNITVDKRIFMTHIGFLQKYKMDKLIAVCQKSQGFPRKSTYEIINSNSLGKHEVYDITVESEDHTYWTGGLLVSNCSELPLANYEACILGSIDVSKFVDKFGNEAETIRNDWLDEDSGGHFNLERVICLGVDLLNRMIDAGHFPLPQIDRQVKRRRRIGLGIMGFADALLKKKIRYGSAESKQYAEDLMQKVQEISHNYSRLQSYNNLTTTTIAPTGSLSILAGCSSGIEPNFAWETEHNRADFGKTIVFHPLAKPYMDRRAILPDYFVKASEVTPREHVEMQATFQKFVDSAISKTVNLPNDASIEDVKEVYKLAYDLKCKGITVYRDGSREDQVLSEVKKPTLGKQGEEIFRDLDEIDRIMEEEPEDEEDFEVESEDFGLDDTLPDHRPYCLDGFVFKERIQMGSKVENVYITIGAYEGMPYEVFVHGNIREAEPIVAQYIDTTTRLLSLSLRSGATLERVIEQLEKVPCSHLYSIPHKIAKVLKEFLPREEIEKGQICECGGKMVYAEGCFHCTSCGTGKCS